MLSDGDAGLDEEPDEEEDQQVGDGHGPRIGTVPREPEPRSLPTLHSSPNPGVRGASHAAGAD